jgi:hypothetical protein
LVPRRQDREGRHNAGDEARPAPPQSAKADFPKFQPPVSTGGDDRGSFFFHPELGMKGDEFRRFPTSAPSASSIPAPAG